MANVMLVSYHFPPSGTIGVPRAMAYMRYLAQNGCRVSVLTASMPQTPGYDWSLCDLIPKDVRVYRAWNPEIPFALRDRLWKGFMSRSPNTVTKTATSNSLANKVATLARKNIQSMAKALLFPDPQITWIPFAVRKAIKAVETNVIDTVVLSVPPFSTLKVGLALKRRFPKLKIITDFRDEWLGYYLLQFENPSPHKVVRARQLEGDAVKASSYISTVTEQWVHRLRARYPNEPPQKFLFTPNGFDPETRSAFKSRLRSDGKMLVSYFGSVQMNRVYSPLKYLAAVESLPLRIRQNVETRFIGRVRPDAAACLRETKAVVQQLGFMPKTQGLALLEETDLLLLIATDPTSHAGKLFDYLAIGKPILALSPVDGEIAKIVRETRTGWCIDPWDMEAIRTTLLQLFNRLKSGETLIDPDWDAISLYSWPNIFKRFVEATRISETYSERREPITGLAHPG